MGKQIEHVVRDSLGVNVPPGTGFTVDSKSHVKCGSGFGLSSPGGNKRGLLLVLPDVRPSHPLEPKPRRGSGPFEGNTLRRANRKGGGNWNTGEWFVFASGCKAPGCAARSLLLIENEAVCYGCLHKQLTQISVS